MAAYGTILTELGERLIARHLLEGGKLELKEFAVGDGGGEDHRPDPGMTALRGEKWRGPVRAVEISEDSPNVIVVDMLVPAEVGGFTIREAGVLDAQGNLIAVMNTPTTYKVIDTEGASTEQYIQMVLAVSSTAAIQLSVDPSAVTATREDVARAEERLRGEGREALEAAREDLRGKGREALAAHDADEAAHPGIWGALAGKSDSRIKTATLVVGTALTGCKESEVDFLCDGIDDQVEINNAIQVLANNGGNIIIREGDYFLTNSIQINQENVIIEGINSSSKLIRNYEGANSSAAMINLSKAFCIVRNLRLDGKRDSTSSYLRGINLTKGADFSLIMNCHIENFSNAAIHIRDCNTGYIHCNFLYRNGAGISIQYSSKYSIVSNLCSENNSWGIYLVVSDHCLVSMNHITDNGSFGFNLGQTGQDFCRDNLIVSNLSLNNQVQEPENGIVKENNTLQSNKIT